ncbi:ParB N-terminal domain-containing protein [Microbacterium testaceum]|uniref:ParB N-terminal domain-containing protein n=1 Tax=Microbacterium testaceum TaxID=2033 RepID=UPI000A737D14|nr:ParB N-terminal domain-containing protein [Microbacterium testaceum]
MPEQPRFDSIPLTSLQFDPQNPRLPGGIDASDRDAVLTFMLDDAGLPDLMGSIAKQGFFPGEPLLVSPGNDGGWVVVEGNRRFASALLLSRPELAPTRRRAVRELADEATAAGTNLDSLPCLVFTKREHILDHLGYRHVTGIKEWDPLAKARFLAQRFESEVGDDATRFRSLARSIGSRSDYVGRLLTAYELYVVMESNSFFAIEGLDASLIDFSLITSLLAYTNVVNYLGLASSQDMRLPNLDVSRLKFLTAFVYQRKDGRTRLGESRNIRTLADVLAAPQAREALEEGKSLRVAAQLTEAGAQVFRSLVASAKESIDLAFDSVADSSLTSEDVALVAEIVEAAGELGRAASHRLAELS